MIPVGAYQKGTNPELDKAIDLHPQIERFLMQEEAEKTSIGETLTAFGKLAGIDIPEEEWKEAENPPDAEAQNPDFTGEDALPKDAKDNKRDSVFDGDETDEEEV